MRRVVHILLAGRALCNQPGPPVIWPADERWVDMREAATPLSGKAVFCTVCKTRWSAVMKLPRWRKLSGIT